MDRTMDAALSSTTRGGDRLVGGTGPGSRRASTAWAVGQALLLHIVVLALLIAGLPESPTAPVPGARGTINVDLIAPDSLSTAMRHTLSPPRPQPAAVTSLPDPAPPEPLAEPVTPAEQSSPGTIIPQTQTAGGQMGSTGAGEAFQANPDLSTQAFSDRRLRVLAIRKANRASQAFSAERSAGASRLRQPAMVSDPTQPVMPPEQVGISLDPSWRAGAGGDADGGLLLTAYEAQLQASILHNWLIPDEAPLGRPCRVTIQQSPQGGILQIRIDEPCPFLEDARASIHDALMASQPLPHEGFESLPIQTLSLVFQRHTP